MALPKLQNPAQLKAGFSLPTQNTGVQFGPQKPQSVDQQNNAASVWNQDKADKAKEDKTGKSGGQPIGALQLANEGATGADGMGNLQAAGNIKGGTGNVAVNAQNNAGTQVASNNNGGQQEGYKQGFADAMKKLGLSEGLC